MIGGFYRREACAPSGHYTSDDAFRYFDDIYIDTSLARVMLANNSNYNQATVVEPQIPSAWSSNLITVKVNLGKFPSSGSAYLFVFDSNNNHNSVGYPVTIGGGNPPPAAPTALRIGN